MCINTYHFQSSLNKYIEYTTHISNHVLSYLLGVGTRPDFIFHVFGDAHTIWLYEHFASILQVTSIYKPMHPAS